MSIVSTLVGTEDNENKVKKKKKNLVYQTPHFYMEEESMEFIKEK